MENNSTYQLRDFWEKDGGDYRAHLGIMTDAVVVRYCLPDKYAFSTKAFYCIGHSSFFPFKKEHYNMRFDNHLDACSFAEEHIMEWFRSIHLVQPEQESRKALRGE